jgi:hypothetical protein
MSFGMWQQRSSWVVMLYAVYCGAQLTQAESICHGPSDCSDATVA